jgi:4-amino-4-deoxy-L-arabinose transferase-like glycosyltransferase
VKQDADVRVVPVRRGVGSHLAVSSLLTIVSIVAVLTAFPVMAWPDVLGNSDTTQTDQEDFLMLGQDIRSGGQWSDGNRQPLLPLVLSTFSSTDWPYFSSAKILNLGLMVLLLALMLWLNGRLFGTQVALLSVVLMIFNPDVRETSARVVAEPLLSILFTLAIYLWYVCVARSDRPLRVRVVMLALAGASAGLGYLTKGTGQLLVLCVVLWWAISGRWRANALPVIAFVVAYLAMIAPLLVHNTQAWGNAFYNFNSTHAMWLDRWEDVWLPSAYDTTLLSYTTSHTVWEMLDRLVSGGISLVVKRGDVFLPTYSVAVLAAGIVTGAAVRCLKHRDHRSPLEPVCTDRLMPRWSFAHVWNVLSLPVAVLLPWLVFFAWYFPISGSARHHIPVLPLVNTIIALIAWRFAASVGSDQVRSYLRVALCVLIIGVCGYGAFSSSAGLLQSHGTWDVYASDRHRNAKLDELLWGLQGLKPQPVVVINGPNRVIPLWRARATTLTIHTIPAACQSVGHLRDTIEQTGADYLIVDALVIQRRACLRSVFRLEDEGSFELVGEVPAMRLMADYSVNRQRIMIFERAG